MSSKTSKSTFIRGIQREKSLYLYKHHYNLKDPISSSLQTTFDQGTNIGILQELFPNGVFHLKIILRWLNLQGKPQIILIMENQLSMKPYLHDDVISALDILVKDNDGWNI